MTLHTAAELRLPPSFINHWVALDAAAAVVDTDEELDELCARLTARHQTSLKILFVAKA